MLMSVRFAQPRLTKIDCSKKFEMIRGLRHWIYTLQIDYTNPLQPRLIERIEDQIYQREMSLEFTINRDAWML